MPSSEKVRFIMLQHASKACIMLQVKNYFHVICRVQKSLKLPAMIRASLSFCF